MDSMPDTAEIRGARLHFSRLAWRASYTAPAETDILPRSLPHCPWSGRNVFGPREKLTPEQASLTSAANKGHSADEAISAPVAAVASHNNLPSLGPIGRRGVR
jgi:hypothetical protein